MPEISRFFGIVIRMYHNDHPPPHFHAIYGAEEALIEIGNLLIYRGGLTRRALAMVLQWAGLHRRELMDNWALARAGHEPKPIEPLE